MAAEEVCAICHEGLGRVNILTTGCNHRFHWPCLAGWQKQHNTCPLCRARLLEETSLQPEVKEAAIVVSEDEDDEEEDQRLAQREWELTVAAEHELDVLRRHVAALEVSVPFFSPSPSSPPSRRRQSSHFLREKRSKKGLPRDAHHRKRGSRKSRKRSQPRVREERSKKALPCRTKKPSTRKQGSRKGRSQH